jgi:hypothetical protein
MVVDRNPAAAHDRPPPGEDCHATNRASRAGVVAEFGAAGDRAARQTTGDIEFRSRIKTRNRTSLSADIARIMGRAP